MKDGSAEPPLPTPLMPMDLSWGRGWRTLIHDMTTGGALLHRCTGIDFNKTIASYVIQIRQSEVVVSTLYI